MSSTCWTLIYKEPVYYFIVPSDLIRAPRQIRISSGSLASLWAAPPFKLLLTNERPGNVPPDQSEAGV